MTILSAGHVHVFVAAGSNVEPEHNLERACTEIVHTWHDARFSRAYRNVAVGFEGPDFINLVTGFTTALPLESVIARLRAIVAEANRLSGYRHPRAICLIHFSLGKAEGPGTSAVPAA